MSNVTKDMAETIRIDHPTSSYGIFCFNSLGDLFLNCDYGFYGYAWRAFGEDFRKFLAQTNADYIVNKFFINWNNEWPKGGKTAWRNRKPHLLNLVNSLIEELKKEAQ